MTEYRHERFPVPTPGRLWRELRLRRPPWWMVAGLMLLIVATWLPLFAIYRYRSQYSTQPKIHYIQDMDMQPGYRPQEPHEMFRDRRSNRRQVPGTVSRDARQLDDHLYCGYRALDGNNTESIEFFAAFPLGIDPHDERVLTRGSDRYQIYCALCHDAKGTGTGIIHQRAVSLGETQWVPPTNLTTPEMRDRSDGQLFQAISAGVRNMPSYDTQIPAEDRWAIVAYVRMLQTQAPAVLSGDTDPMDIHNSVEQE